MNVEGEGRAVAAPCIGFALSRLLLAKLKLELHRLPVVSNKLIGDSLNVNLHAVDDDAADVGKFPLPNRPRLRVHLATGRSGKRELGLIIGMVKAVRASP